MNIGTLLTFGYGDFGSVNSSIILGLFPEDGGSPPVSTSYRNLLLLGLG